jgi:protein-tyrosine-phosphatase
MNLLFVCSRNRLRSPTAEVVFAELSGHAIPSAGTSADAETVVSADLVEWAGEGISTHQGQSDPVRQLTEMAFCGNSDDPLVFRRFLDVVDDQHDRCAPSRH